jgi:glycerol transport system ATP-binding protein
VHQELKLTLIYVTHDQVEALTFAQQVMVMTRGRAVQVGSASELFERPRHTFVGHFIGSPGMNFLPARGTGQGIEVAGHALAAPDAGLAGMDRFTLGVRPEYVQWVPANAAGAVPGLVTQAQDIGTYWLVTAQVGPAAEAQVLRARLGPEQVIPRVGETVWLSVVGAHTCYYRNEELIE